MLACPNCQKMNHEKSRRNHFECSCGCWYDLIDGNIILHEAWPIVKNWNDTYPVGQDVVVKEDFKPKGTITKTISQARIMCGSPVIWCERISGAYDLDCVTPI